MNRLMRFSSSMKRDPAIEVWAHVNVRFFRGAEIADPAALLEGTGKFMRHVKLWPGRDVDAAAVTTLIETAYADIKSRLTTE